MSYTGSDAQYIEDEAASPKTDQALDEIMLLVDSLDCGNPKHYMRQNKIRQLIDKEYISRKRVSEAIGEDEERHQLLDDGLWHLIPDSVARNKLRAELRKELELQ